MPHTRNLLKVDYITAIAPGTGRHRDICLGGAVPRGAGGVGSRRNEELELVEKARIYDFGLDCVTPRVR